ncbi:S-adenosylmethionine--2-demethylmenaquinone methyltransferase [Bacillus pseudomycoides]|uniref:ribonuclease E activity regulator RraA n=1 Tax=Bacillus pseudomycoides TaxID=64104 RepID=UPI000BF9D41E|nr:ribonuclease E activity regulator RraA [Bacillus pseudomycoides]PGE97940.1 S-adenosylmethionine--2-demethylmenaquinone methyltransferase [Bacillus pseudomycoides]PHB21481.1 S-adenosylmethionine--2-demethylmenaquinone methyltransferase [Bacillus pseudomycoides]PHE36757.1 S-adenosylmethionine--2-demethylmenaquinone methyltransferase [Bacillus pseudomycoides]
MWRTTDLCDAFEGDVQVCKPIFQSYGKKERFHGKIATVKVKDDNVLVKEALQTLPEGTVLVVDGGASTNCALLGDNLANIAKERNIAGIIVYGCVRDSKELRNINIGILALGTMPKRSRKEGKGETEIPLQFGEIEWIPNQYVYADEDGIIVCEQPIHSNL